MRVEREDNKSKIFELEASLKTAKKNIKDLEVRKRKMYMYTHVYMYMYIIIILIYSALLIH